MQVSAVSPINITYHNVVMTCSRQELVNPYIPLITTVFKVVFPMIFYVAKVHTAVIILDVGGSGV